MALAPHTWLAGDELGNHFADVRLLHAGSRFTIYEGVELTTRRRVAVKVPDDAGASWIHDVLRREAGVLAAISSHPHIVTMYGRLDLADGRPCLVLERCADALISWLHGGEPLPVPEAVAIGIKLSGALETAHNANVLHCDVRPGNVLISEYGEPVLAGWDESVTTTDTDPRPPLHVPTAHTAPELLEGGDPTPAADTYGLAATLYELITGRAAFREYVGESAASVIVRVLSGQVKPIVVPGVPLDLSDLLTWSLAAEPAKRPPSPAWLAEELARIEAREGWPRTHSVTG